MMAPAYPGPRLLKLTYRTQSFIYASPSPAAKGKNGRKVWRCGSAAVRRLCGAGVRGCGGAEVREQPVEGSTSALLDFRTPGLPHSWTSALLDFRTSALLHFRTPALPHSR